MMESIELDFRDDALDAIAEKALARKSGARGLRSILENALKQIMFDLPSYENLQRVVIDKSVINKNKEPYLIFAKTESKKTS